MDKFSSVEEILDFAIREEEQAAAASVSFERLSVAEAKRRLDDGWAPYVLDVRKPHEAEIVRIVEPPGTALDEIAPFEAAEIQDGERGRLAPGLAFLRFGERHGRHAGCAQQGETQHHARRFRRIAHG